MTLSSMGCHPLSVVTAVTVQDTTGVEDIFPLDAEWVADQARCILEDVPVAVFKLGVLGSLESIAAIAEIVSDYPEIPLVLDPIFASGRGDELASEDMIAAMKDLIIPQSTIITPNTLEILRLTADDSQEEDHQDLNLAAEEILATGCEYVLITGTHHHTTQVINTLYGREGVIRADGWERLAGSYHGSGCTLSSAIAAGLAQGLDIAEAVAEAQEYTWQTLKDAFRLGMGQRIPDRLFWAREDRQAGDTH
ncbi:MAG: hydroxymethylpyrimidine/phosphomethylpyrimidine kinase [Ferrovum sp. 34-44-207]|nr:MAG: hydroxymethylpyrimidine/phosphomethylpyrimidine kinase [Ferrovum sp. 34-44-207]